VIFDKRDLIEYPDRIFKDESHPEDHDEVVDPVQGRTGLFKFDSPVVAAAATFLGHVVDFRLLELLERGEEAFER